MRKGAGFTLISQSPAGPPRHRLQSQRGALPLPAWQPLHGTPQAFQAFRLGFHGRRGVSVPAGLVRIGGAFLFPLGLQVVKRPARIATKAGGVPQGLKFISAVFALLPGVHGGIISRFPYGKQAFL